MNTEPRAIDDLDAFAAAYSVAWTQGRGGHGQPDGTGAPALELCENLGPRP